MGRWEPNARERLEEAAMELFHERGYTRTTVEEIAARAGLTERTFFRYFADKREVLFWGSSALEKLIVDAIAAAPMDTAPLEAVTAALETASPMFEQRRERAGKRHVLIETHAELRERELIKLSSIAAAIAASLHTRGVADPVAGLTAEIGIAVFKIAFECWVKDDEGRDFVHHVRATRDKLEVIVTRDGVHAPAKTGAQD